VCGWLCYNTVFRVCQVCGKDAERMRKKSKSLKIKHLMNFFPHFRLCGKTRPQARPHPLARFFFAGKNCNISIHLQTSGISVIKCVKSLKIKGLRLSARLSASFPQTFRKLDNFKNMHHNQAPPHPAPHP